jgi:Tol biopolymer transport system component
MMKIPVLTNRPALWITVLVCQLSFSGSVTATRIDKDSLRNHKSYEWKTPINLGPGVNSSANDLAPALSKDGLTLYFSSTRLAGGFGGEDIWVSRRDPKTGEWGEPVNIGPVVNSIGMERVRYLSPDGRLLLFQSDRGQGEGGSDIWATTRKRMHDDLAWGRPVNLGSVINSPMNELGATYLFGNSGINHKLFISSNRPGGLGGADLYSSDIPDGGSFGVPVNLTELNSASNDTCMSISSDGLEIIFSSNRPDLNNLMSAFDLWVSTRSSIFDAWSVPKNLGSTVNAEGFLDANPALSFDGTTLVFTSTRTNGLGGMDLYISTREKRLKLSENVSLAIK